MAKLYFRYGTVSSAKSMNLLAVVHNYEAQNKKAVLLKPKLDDRFGVEKVRSRAGLERLADIVVDEHSHHSLSLDEFENASCIVVDEAQFLTPEFVDLLRVITIDLNIPVICYGLRTDFKRELFAGSKRLLELADSVEEIKTVCNYCNSKAVYNLKVLNGNPTIEGPQIDLGTEEKYLPVCGFHYDRKLSHYVDDSFEESLSGLIH
jgi:thymidine kinase